MSDIKTYDEHKNKKLIDKIEEEIDGKLDARVEEKIEEIVEEIEDKENKKKRILVIIIIVLILLLFLIWIPLLTIGYRMGKVGYFETKGKPIESVIQVKQKDIDADIIEDLDIFENKEFDNKKIIAPLSTGSYNFKVQNLTDSNITYNIKLNEKNDWDINLKYRLKLDNVYVMGNADSWIDIDGMHIDNIIVPKGSDNVYTIEWYWEEAENDTAIGESLDAEYKLTIEVDSAVYDGEV